MTDAILASSGIYAITNTVNGRRYVGQSANIASRKRAHMGMLGRGNHHCIALQRSYVKHGKEAFVHEVLELCGPELLTEREQYWMDLHRAEGLYNLAPAAGSNAGYRHTDETRAKFSAAKTGSKNSEAGKASRRASFTEDRREISRKNGLRSVARLTSDEHKERVRLARIGISLSDETKAKISAAHKGVPKSDEHRQKMSETRRGRIVSEETREKMRKSQALAKEMKRAKALAQWAKPGAREAASASRKGREVSDATKKKLSDANLLRWARYRQTA